MPSNTTRLGLLKKDPITDGNHTFNIKTMMNDNWDKIDEMVAILDPETGKLPADQIDIDTSDFANAKDLTTHLADYLSHTGYAVATGSANAYIATLSPALSAYAEGVSLRIKINVDNTGASTVNVNGLGPKSIKKSNGNAVSTGNLKTGIVYTLAYDGTAFILQGEGGEYGTATPGDVLLGKTIGTENGVILGTLALTGNAVAANVLEGQTFYNTNAKQKEIGAMANNAGRGFPATDIRFPANYSDTLLDVFLPFRGYYTEGSFVEIYDADFKAANIRKGVNIFGVPGTLDISSLGGKKMAKGIGRTGFGSNYLLSVRGLSFTPSTIIARPINAMDEHYYGLTAWTKGANVSNNTGKDAGVRINNADGSTFTVTVKTMYADGFDISTVVENLDVGWIAYE